MDEFSRQQPIIQKNLANGSINPRQSYVMSEWLNVLSERPDATSLHHCCKPNISYKGIRATAPYAIGGGPVAGNIDISSNLRPMSSTSGPLREITDQPTERNLININNIMPAITPFLPGGESTRANYRNNI